MLFSAYHDGMFSMETTVARKLWGKNPPVCFLWLCVWTFGVIIFCSCSNYFKICLSLPIFHPLFQGSCEKKTVNQELPADCVIGCISKRIVWAFSLFFTNLWEASSVLVKKWFVKLGKSEAVQVPCFLETVGLAMRSV